MEALKLPPPEEPPTRNNSPYQAFGLWDRLGYGLMFAGSLYCIRLGAYGFWYLATKDAGKGIAWVHLILGAFSVYLAPLTLLIMILGKEKGSATCRKFNEAVIGFSRKGVDPLFLKLLPVLSKMLNLTVGVSKVAIVLLCLGVAIWALFSFFGWLGTIPGWAAVIIILLLLK
jgi:hypothetical protein